MDSQKKTFLVNYYLDTSRHFEYKVPEGGAPSKIIPKQ